MTIAMIEYFFGKSIEGIFTDFNLITTKNTMVAIHVTIIGIKNIPSSNGFMAFSVINCEMNDCWLVDAYNAGNSAGMIAKIVIVIENKNTKCDNLLLLEKINM